MDPEVDGGDGSGARSGAGNGAAATQAGSGGAAGTHVGEGGEGAGGSSVIAAEAGAGGEAGGSGPGDACAACTSTQLCVLSVCQDPVCSPNQPACEGNRATTCDASGFGYSQAGARCTAGQSCEAGECKRASACPNLYFGTDRFGDRPQPHLTDNDGLFMNSYDVKVNRVVFGQLRINNHGTDDAPSTHVELYWTERGSTPLALPNRLIFEDDVVVPGSALGADSDEQWTINWSYGFPTVGQFYLLARLSNNSPALNSCLSQGYDSSSPAVDPQSAIHEINVGP